MKDFASPSAPVTVVTFLFLFSPTVPVIMVSRTNIEGEPPDWEADGGRNL